MGAFWSLALLLLFGCHFLHFTLSNYVSALKPALGGIQIPIVSIDLSGSFLIASLIFLGGIVWLHGWLQKPKVADLLIDTEAELKKVTWPSSQEVVNSALVVIISVAILMGFLAGADYVLGRVVKYLIFKT